MQKPVGSQHSFSNLDGARASIDSADRLSISSERPEEEEADEADEEEGSVPSPAASPESHLPDDVLIWVDGQPMLVPVTCDIATEHPDASLSYWEQEERRKKEEEKEEKEEKFLLCESIGHRPLRGRCPKMGRPTNRPTDQPTDRRTQPVIDWLCRT